MDKLGILKRTAVVVIVVFLNPKERNWAETSIIIPLQVSLSGLHKKAWPEIPRGGPKGRVDVATAAAWRIMSLHLSGTSYLYPWVQYLRTWQLYCIQQMVMAQYNWISLSWHILCQVFPEDEDTICHLFYYPMSVWTLCGAAAICALLQSIFSQVRFEDS